MSSKKKNRKAAAPGEPEQQPTDKTQAKPAPKPKPKTEAQIRFHQKDDTIMHRWDLTDVEMRKIGVEVGQLGNEIDNITSQAKATANDFKSRIELKTSQRDALSQKLANQYEMRETKTIIVYDVKTQTKTFVNPKNKKQVYRGPEPMTDADRVMEMFKKKDITKPVAKTPAAEAGPVEEAAGAQPKLELDIDEIASEARDDATKIIAAFRKKANESGWKGKAISGVSLQAKSQIEKGLSFVLNYLRQFCIEK